jgi:pyrroline-5-carboxylate reductase
MKIAILGGGNLGIAIAEGLLNKKFCKASDIIVTRRNVNAIAHLAKKGILTTSQNKEAAQKADLVLLAVKPYNYQDVLKEIKPVLKKQILVSVITGVWIKQLQEQTNAKLPIVRAMPNTAIAIGQSMTCISSQNTNADQLAFITNLFNALGQTVQIDEKLMDAATVLGACGTAYAMRYIRANIQGGIEIGFDAKTANLIAAQTVLGAAQMLLEKNTHPEQEIDKVTTPKGCTIAGLNEMEHQGFSSSLIRGITASYKKIIQ